jgi:uncharacterized protein (TIGR02145 family)
MKRIHISTLALLFNANIFTKAHKIALAVFILTICNILNAQQTVTDIDGNVYNTVTIGTQKWMKENLKTTHYSNGDSIANITDAAEWINLASGAFSNYNNDSNNVAVHGRLYNGFAVIDNRNLCPSGWHVSTDSEWTTLTTFLGGESVAGGKMKETGTTNWNSPNTGATNASGFTALASGGRMYTNGTFQYKGQYGGWWSSTEQDDSIHIKYRNISYIENNVGNYSSPKPFGISVRCLEDPIPDSAKYFGQTPPGNKAVKFAPGIISLPDRLEGSIAFTPDGNECYFGVYEYINGSFLNKIFYTKLVNNTWTKKEEAKFSIGQNVSLISLSSDGKRLFFEKDGDIWKVERTTGEWGELQCLPAPINSASTETGYTETADGIVYFDSNRPGGFGQYYDIWRINPTTAQAEDLGSIVNSGITQATPCIAPDGSYLIFSRLINERPSLVISFNKGNDVWTVPVDMDRSGAGINILNQISPLLSPDGKYLFFNRHTGFPITNIADIYWVSTSIIDTLKKIAMPTVSVNQTFEQNVKLYPNPTNGPITLSLGTSQNREALVEIYNLQGSQVFSKTFQNTTTVTIDLTGNSAGIYVVKVIADGVCFEEKILKE